MSSIKVPWFNPQLRKSPSPDNARQEDRARLGVSIPGSSEERLLHLLQAEKGLRHNKYSELTALLPDLLEAMPPEAVPRCRAMLDAGLVFRTDSTAADLRSIVFCDLELEAQKRVLARIRAACRAPDPAQPGLVVLTDVDDTLLPGADALQIAGSDRSWHLDGQLYPGVCRLHRELRNGLRESYGGDYSVLLTARPPRLIRHLPERFPRLTGLKNPRMAILPGEGGAQMALNTIRVLAGNYERLGITKLARMRQYASLFPDCMGRFVFIGDDGQADLAAAEEMLQLTSVPSRAGLDRGSTPILAFVAIKACAKAERKDNVTEAQRNDVVQRIRNRYRPVPEDKAVGRGPPGAARHRFFYFDDYWDLAEQLARAGWLAPEQRDAVHRAVTRDAIPDPAAMVRNCDLEGLVAAIEMKKAHSIEEADEVELETFAWCQTSLPVVAAAHLHFGSPPPGTTGLRLQATVAKIGGIYWPGHGWASAPAGKERQMPRFSIWDSEAKATNSAAIEVMGNSELRLKWPNEVLSRRSARPALDVAFGTTVARCYIRLKDEPQYGHTGGDLELDGDARLLSAALVAFDAAGPDPTTRIGEVHVRVTWVVDS